MPHQHPPADFAPFILATYNESPHKAQRQQALPGQRCGWVLLLALEGGLSFQQGRRRTILANRQLLLVHPAQAGHLHIAAGARYRRLDFDVTPRPRQLTGYDWWPQAPVCDQPGPQQLWGLDLPLVLPEAWQEASECMIRQVCDRWWQDDALGRFRCHTLLAAWLGWVVERCRPQGLDRQTAATLPNWVQAAEDYARQSLGTGVRVRDLAALVGMHRNAFTRAYQMIRGHHPRAFLAQARLQLACSLLRDTPHDLRRIATTVGHASVASFSRDFRHRTGLSPGRWRRQERSGR